MPVPNFKNIKELKKWINDQKRQKKSLPTQGEINAAKEKFKPLKSK